MTIEMFDRRAYLKAVALAGSTGLAGCMGGSEDGQGSPNGGGGEQTGSGGTPWVRDHPQEPSQEIVYPNLGQVTNDPATLRGINTFEEETDLNVRAIGISPDSLLQYTRSRLQAQNTETDAYEVYANITWSLAQQGYFEEVGHGIDDEHVEGWADGVKEAFTLPLSFMQDFPYRDGIYEVPMYDDTWIAFANRSVMEEAGYDPERDITTFSEFKQVATDMKDVVDTPVVMPYSSPGEGGGIFTSLVARSGGEYFDGRTPSFTSEGVRTGAEFFLSLFEEGLAPKGVTSMTEGRATQRFFGGDAGLMFNATANIFFSGKDLPIDESAAEAARIMQFPKPEGVSDTPSLSLTPTGLSLSVFSPNKENTLRWMNHMCSRQVNKWQLKMEGKMALYPSIYEDTDVQEEVPYASVMGDALRNSTVMKYPNTAEIRSMVYSQVQQAIGQGMSADQLVQNLQRNAKQIV